jgi:hypothetical protein
VESGALGGAEGGTETEEALRAPTSEAVLEMGDGVGEICASRLRFGCHSPLLDVGRNEDPVGEERRPPDNAPGPGFAGANLLDDGGGPGGGAYIWTVQMRFLQLTGFRSVAHIAIRPRTNTTPKGRAATIRESRCTSERSCQTVEHT